MAPSAIQALEILRDPSGFHWYIIPILLIVIYIYALEIERGNWSTVLAGLSFWGMDWFNEIWNALVFKLTGYAPVWSAPSRTSLLILIGLNIEISLGFLIMGVASVKLLPENKKMKILGIPNRLFIASILSVLCVIVEIYLNHAGALVWEYRWWSARFPLLIFLIGYMPFFLTCFHVYDTDDRRKQLKIVSTIFGFNALLIVIFGLILKWL